MAKNWHIDTPVGWKEKKEYVEYHENRPKGYWDEFMKSLSIRRKEILGLASK